MRYPIFAAGALLATMAGAQTPVLTVYTYDSFISEWGPGPQVEAAFEATCGCDLQFVGAGDGAALLGRLRLEGKRTHADVVLGLDTNLTAAAAETGLFAPHGVADVALSLPVSWEDELFLPYDWGYFAFVYDKTKLPHPPASFAELAAAPKALKIVIQDPRSSTPGLGLLLWVKAAYGDGAQAMWQGLAPHILTVTKGWSEAYGMFLEGEADMVLSYTTSPAYHIIAEGDDTKAAAPFAEGHYMQVEVAGRIASSDQPELAQEFLRFMLSETFQSIIPTTNWMYPAVIPDGGLPEGFSAPLPPEQSLIYPAAEAAAMRDKALEEWRAALSR
ncbi:MULTISPECIES: thiamine ABC transporter substrate binding subunit [Actibacterium]|uniref:Thiamine-binding periplasmic protein n=1 Tax=Actibacterium naphthalenivorans TaxID=1614693 RepID=A0A840C728_9RHOB|nr:MULTISPECIES: thiamine ABC transporter substrate binding subunit [Actibacterium]ALG91618.1 thiamine ABC transporter substrate-binding protein [Actibacterium sp. EMB200-NS6]MBB4021751.1 thiamine transport system substrate-binding protein [Actibacterium naphthalenivorans]